MPESKIRTVTLSDRPPVRINEDDWEVIASASDKEFDNEYEFQANRISKWFVGVRRHDDGRTLVYATYTYTSNYQNARCYTAKHGALLTAEEATPTKIVATIKDVAERMESAEHDGEDEKRWPTLANECIADLPPEEL